MSMNCENAQLKISASSEEDLPKSDMCALYAHLKECKACAAYQMELDHIQSCLTSSLRENEYSEDISGAVMYQLLAHQPRNRPDTRFVRVFAGAVSIIFAIFIYANAMLNAPRAEKNKMILHPTEQAKIVLAKPKDNANKNSSSATVPVGLAKTRHNKHRLRIKKSTLESDSAQPTEKQTAEVYHIATQCKRPDSGVEMTSAIRSKSTTIYATQNFVSYLPPNEHANVARPPLVSKGIDDEIAIQTDRG